MRHVERVGHIHVISCGIAMTAQNMQKADTTLSIDVLHYIHDAEHIFASKALLVSFAQHMDAHKQHLHPIAAKAREDASCALALCREGKQVVVLASGDALYNGMGGTLLSLRKGEAITFHAHITAFQALFHKLALPWSGVALFSVHGQKSIPVRRIAAEPFSLTYGGTNFPASSIAKSLVDFMPAAKNNLAVLAERLGSEHEHIRIDTLGALADMPCHATSILLMVPSDYYAHILDITAQNFPIYYNQTAAAPILALGLPEDHYVRENNLITASDVRAVILSRLRLPAFGTLWDLGAGSGSVGLEAAALCPHLKVVAVEQKEQRIQHMYANQERMGVVNYHIHHANALDFLHKTEQLDNAHCRHSDALAHKDATRPDRIFIGGGGADIAQLIKLSLARLAPEGLLVVSAVTLESFHAIARCAPEHRIGLSSIQLAHEEKIAGEYHSLKNQNTIYIFTFAVRRR